ncbi:MAG: hypothetical protein H8E12_24385 [Rhodobacteraceae bacterium]|nr:hypothetical protein [Paracoccaceae bacterium]
MARHNKKRNAGLIYELLVQRLSKAVVENDSRNIKVTKHILQKHYKRGSELYKEFRLFNALLVTNGVTDQLAYRIISEARNAATNHDATRLNKEKSLLIKDINHILNETNFYNRKIQNYQVYASVQQLLNNWRSTELDITETARHEKTVHDWLLCEKNSVTIADQKTAGVNDLTLLVMQEKFESKYGSILTDNQLELLRAYSAGVDVLPIIETTVKTTRKQIDKYIKLSPTGFLSERVKRTKAVLQEYSFTPSLLDVSRAMALEQLIDELTEATSV